jgi:diaminopropionate ammonia-lyase
VVCYAEVQFSFNPFREPIEPSPWSGAAAWPFHRNMPGYQPTPLRSCPQLARAAGVQSVVVKDESARFGLNSFKILGASWAMSQLARNGPRLPPVASATAGNHGRAVAWMARQMGIRATIFVPAGTMLRRMQNIRKEGADVRVVDGNYEAAVKECAAVSRKHGWRVISDTGYPGCTEVPDWVVEGYSTLFAESDAQRAALELARPDAVLVQAGVGGLLSAAVRHFRTGLDGPVLVSVEPADACCLLESIRSPGGRPTTGTGSQTSIMAGLNCAEVSLTAWSSIRSGVDLFVTIDDSRAIDAARLFRETQIDAGESGAAGLAGLLALGTDPGFHEAKSRLGLNESSHVMLINTEASVEAPMAARV